jgi:polyisoprenoid-binding protein YceI
MSRRNDVAACDWGRDMGEPAVDMVIDRYVIDEALSRVVVRAFAAGLLAGFGHDPVMAVRELAGDVRFSPAKPGESAVHIEAVAASLEAQGDVAEHERREIERVARGDVLQAGRYPTIVYEAPRAVVEQMTAGRFRATLDGELTLRAVTRPLRVIAQVLLDGEMLRAHGDVPIRQTEFGIAPVSAIGGTLRIKDEVVCSFDIVSRKAA